MQSRALLFQLVLLSIAAVAGCGSSDGSSGSLPRAGEDERGAVGPASPASVYCEEIGFKIVDESCIFPDGTSCEQWAFHRATCGQQHSYCNRHGGLIASRELDSGGFLILTAVCSVGGKECLEEDYYRKGTCD